MTSEEAVLVVELTPEEMEAQLREEEQKRQEIETNLANCVETKFQERALRRGSKELQWLRAASLYYGALAVDGASQGSETPFQNSSKTKNRGTAICIHKDIRTCAKNEKFLTRRD